MPLTARTTSSAAVESGHGGTGNAIRRSSSIVFNNMYILSSKYLNMSSCLALIELRCLTNISPRIQSSRPDLRRLPAARLRRGRRCRARLARRGCLPRRCSRACTLPGLGALRRSPPHSIATVEVDLVQERLYCPQSCLGLAQSKPLLQASDGQYFGGDRCEPISNL